jgi:hypothetical protein
MHPPHVRAEAIALIEQDLNDCEVSRRLGIPRGTIRDWRRPTYVSRRETPLGICPRCWRAAKAIRFTPDDYAELLGLYLGDGWISPGPRTFRLRIALDAKYPVIIQETRQLLLRSMPENAVYVLRAGLTGKLVNVSVYSNHLPCLFPQHGPGVKHGRSIQLEGWQRDLVDEAPWSFLRGCIRSDGCCFINRTNIDRPEPYEYRSYDFSNASQDILDIVGEVCEQLDLRPRRAWNPTRGLGHVRINRRDSVARMLDRVGLKT